MAHVFFLRISSLLIGPLQLVQAGLPIHILAWGTIEKELARNSRQNLEVSQISKKCNEM